MKVSVVLGMWFWELIEEGCLASIEAAPDVGWILLLQFPICIVMIFFSSLGIRAEKVVRLIRPGVYRVGAIDV